MTTKTAADLRAEDAMAVSPYASDRDGIARARRRVAGEIRLNRDQLMHLAQGAYRSQELTDLFDTMDQVVQRLKRLGARLDELEAMSRG